MAGKYIISIYSVQKHRTKSNARRTSNWDKKQVAWIEQFSSSFSAGFEIYESCEVVSSNTQFIHIIISLQLMRNWGTIGKCWLVLTWCPGIFDSLGDVLNKYSMRRHEWGGRRLKFAGVLCKVCSWILCHLDNTLFHGEFDCTLFYQNCIIFLTLVILNDFTF